MNIVLFTVPEVGESKIKGLAGSVSDEGLFAGPEMVPKSLSLCSDRSKLTTLWDLSYQITNPKHLPSWPNYFHTPPIHMLAAQGVSYPQINLEDHKHLGYTLSWGCPWDILLFHLTKTSFLCSNSKEEEKWKRQHWGIGSMGDELTQLSLFPWSISMQLWNSK